MRHSSFAHSFLMKRTVRAALGALPVMVNSLGAQLDTTQVQCYQFDRHYFSWVGRPPEGGAVFRDSTRLIRLTAGPRPIDRFLRGPSDARALVPPTMRVDSFATRSWLRSSYWRHVMPDSLEVVWRNGLYGPVFRMGVKGDSLQGRVRFTTDVVGGERPPERAGAVRAACPKAHGAPSNPRLDADGRANGARPRDGRRRRDR